MRLRTWPLLTIGFGALLLLIGLSAAALYERMDRVYREVAAIQEREQQTRDLLNRLRSDLYETAILTRDYLLEPSLTNAESDRQELDKLRETMQQNLDKMMRMVQADHLEKAVGLREAILKYWTSLDPVFRWTPAQKPVRARWFLRQSIMPSRDEVLEAAERLGEVNTRQTLQRKQEILETERRLKWDLQRIAGLSLLLGAIVAFAGVMRTRYLEGMAEAHMEQIEHSAQELRRLSRRLSSAQENERRSLSRELHDQIGQMLTALRMELTNVEDFRHSPGQQFTDHLNEAKKLAEETLRSVRNLSSGLRPSVLDELGLAPALRWQAREFTQRSGVPVEIDIDGELGELPDAYRTCIYRVVQEALTNCGRHAKASKVRVTLHGGLDNLFLTVEDDGAGFDVPSARGRGLGLLGIEERVRELGGRVEFISQPSKGSLLRCEIPVRKAVTA
jgi:signal transduction histidine kinase